MSVEQIGGWDRADGFEEVREEEYERLVGEVERSKETIKEGGFGGEEGLGKVSVCPFEGRWWKVFWTEMWRDAQRWEKVRRSMGRGRCRVVLRWEEWAPAAEKIVGLGLGGEDVEMEGTGGGVGEKKKAGGKRVTRAEAAKRSRSGLGIGDGSLTAAGRAVVGAKDKVKKKR